ncbi:hypothetical protein M5D96_004523 [Drosophila gunungcola]|uniref:Uncharacterized protein n=1 Tax=Drosophila gunungcola TaxID=103775 RepID=A0A9P9YU96_9MUSC|nr:hypothetical protein M5D96_004523 [Drosophila gunungcola]
MDADAAFVARKRKTVRQFIPIDSFANTRLQKQQPLSQGTSNIHSQGCDSEKLNLSCMWCKTSFGRCWPQCQKCRRFGSLSVDQSVSQSPLSNIEGKYTQAYSNERRHLQFCCRFCCWLFCAHLKIKQH